MNKEDYDKIVIEFLKYQGYHAVANEYTKEKGLEIKNDNFCELRTEIRKLISDGKYKQMEDKLMEYNFEMITSTKILDYVSRQKSIECIAKGDYENALNNLQNLTINVDDVLEKIVYQQTVNIKESRLLTAEIVNQILMFQFGESRNVLVEIIEKIGISKTLSFISSEKKND